MKTMVVTGGTDGMGAALVRHYLRGGEQVVVVGRSRAKFDALVAAIAAEGVPLVAERSHFHESDLSLITDCRRLLEHIRGRFERIDVLVLAASFIRQKRHVTREGHEASWALFFVSKYLLVTGLADRMVAAEQPVILNFSVPGAKVDALDFHDLELTEAFSFARSNAQQRRANELLGILATQDPNISYVTYGPKGLVKTSLAGDVGPVIKYASVLLAPLIGQAPDEAVQPLIALIADPPLGRVAYRGPKKVPLNHGTDDEFDARRLNSLVENSISGS
ncbi:MAG: SDR family NAD(P)-dependent oxidoreductase [Microbacterium sp.]|uniref:SDR family NAD(P)-dependent oxidoreductase n=1 Tax=Microbacterium sp. TaxID=51671 RepID=UPI003F9B0773